jgi:nitroimidazol reductase NimA-like FMN-containing flavoprotein (pyridoxamine 5'-phosphate oxidase superfamily)
LPWGWAEERLASSRNYWIATARAGGSPHAMPVWGVWIDDAVVFGTSARSRKGRNLTRDPRVVVHLESGDEVVVLEGEV